MSTFARWTVPLLVAAALGARADPLPDPIDDPEPTPLTLSFYGQGTVQWVEPPTYFTYQLEVRRETTTYGLNGEQWQLESRFSFDLGSYTGAGTGQFVGLTYPSDTIRFDFQSASGDSGLDLSYTITGGTGRFAGATGSGSSIVQLYGDPRFLMAIPYGELGGELMVTLPPVPEPSGAALLALGLAALGVAVRRRGDADLRP